VHLSRRLFTALMTVYQGMLNHPQTLHYVPRAPMKGREEEQEGLAPSPSMGHAIWRTTTRFSSPTADGSSTSTLSVAPRANAARMHYNSVGGLPAAVDEAGLSGMQHAPGARLQAHSADSMELQAVKLTDAQHRAYVALRSTNSIAW